MAKLKTKFIEDNAVTDSKIKLANQGYLKARNNADSADVNIVKINASDVIEFASTPQVGGSNVLLASDKGVANGVASLDGSGKVPVAQLPSAIMTYEGVWNASTNTPSLADGVGDAGMVYRVSVAGSQDLGSGSISFDIGDYVIYNGTTWEKSDTTDAVASVNGFSGVVVLDTDDVSEGSTNLYFTEARARTAAVDNTAFGPSWSGVTTIAPSKDAVYAAINAVTGSNQGRQVITLSGADITNGYVDLAQEALSSSLHVAPVGGPEQEPGVDFTESVVSSVTRVTFAGDLASVLVAGDKLIVHYEYA